MRGCASSNHAPPRAGLRRGVADACAARDSRAVGIALGNRTAGMASSPLVIAATAPVGSVAIAGTLVNGQLATRNAVLALRLAFDGAPVTMAFSTDGGATYGTSRAYSSGTSLTLPSGSCPVAIHFSRSLVA